MKKSITASIVKPKDKPCQILTRLANPDQGLLSAGPCFVSVVLSQFSAVC